MRGKLDQLHASVLQHRIIPAHAGQTVCRCRAKYRHADHPRACGANMDGRYGAQCWDGSSPRMRGKPSPCIFSRLFSRIIPAHAGQTCVASASTPPKPDHPRACGANVNTWSPIDLNIGSSPRMRGKPYGDPFAEDRGRIIPAHAGQTSTPSRDWFRRRIIPAHAGQTAEATAYASERTDHPRACGAND